MPRTYRVNHVVGLDLIYVKNLKGEQELWLNCICWGSNFQLVQRLGNENQKSAENVWKTFVECWLRFMGHPKILVVDSGTEIPGIFCGSLRRQRTYVATD